MLAPRLARWWVQYVNEFGDQVSYCNYAPKPPALIIRTRFRKSVGTGTLCSAQPYSWHGNHHV